MKRVFPINIKLFMLVLVVGAMTGLAVVSAQTAVTKSDDYVEKTRYMARFLLDKQPTENLQSLSSTPCVGGFAGEYPCENVDLLSFLPLSEIGGGSGNDIWGWTDSTTGKEYAIMGRSTGTSFVDISDPENPIYLGNLPTHTSSSSWRDVKVYADHAFIVSEASNHGMQIFDLTELRDVVSPPVTFANTAHYSGFGSAHNVVINEESGYAYGVGADCSGGLHMVDISDPTNPTDSGCFSADGYTHDAQCVIYNGPDTAHVGSEICLNSNEDTLTIVDVSDKANPQQLSRTGYTGSAYSHQGWLTEDHAYFLLDDELDESNNGHNTYTYIWDVSDLDSPTLIGTYVADTPAIDHNMYVKDDYVYQANYRAGLRILDLADVENGNLSEFGYFDIYPTSDSASFNGAWSTYPYFESGVVIVSGIEQGLYVLQPGLEQDFRLSVTPTAQDMCVGEDAVYDISVTSMLGFSDLVTLSAPNLPTNMTSAFSENPVAPDSAGSELTLGTTGVATGTYMIDIVGASISRTHTTTVQLDLFTESPATPTLLTPADEAVGVDEDVAFSWEAAAYASEYMLEVATDDTFNTIVYSATVDTTSHTASVDTQATYYWRVTPSNSCGVGTTSATFSFTTESAPGQCNVGTDPNIVYSDDFETGAAGWTHSSGIGPDTWALSSSNPHGGSMSFHADNVGELSDQYLVSPAIVLPSGQSPLTFQFWNYQEMEDGGAGCYDGGVLEISTDGGSSWTYLDDELLTDPYDGAIDAGYNNPLIGSDAWCGDPQAYLNSIVDIDAFAGETVHFRFRLGTDSSVSHPGWDIDDVVVQSCQSSDYVVEISPDQGTATTSGAAVNYTLTLSNTGMMADSYDITVSGNNWSSTPSVSSLSLAAGESGSFEVMVDVPADAIGGSSDMVEVTAVSQNNGSTVATAVLNTSVEVIYGIESSAVATELTTESGTMLTYTVWVTNTGNVTNEVDLSASGIWTTNISPDSVTLAPHNDSVMVDVVVTVPEDAVSGSSHTITVTGTPQSGGDPTEILLTVHVVNGYIIYLPFIANP